MSENRDISVPADTDERKSCWVCFASEEDDRAALWVKPCRCRGTTKWVHQTCLQRWIDEKQKGNTTLNVVCPQCHTEYIIVFPKLGCLALAGPIVYAMDLCDRIIYKFCPFVAAGVMIGSVYWTGVTYGAVTVLQILGQKEGLSYMEQVDPLLLLLGLPTIPIMLILGKMVRWEDYLLRAWRRHSAKIPLLGTFLRETQEAEPQQGYNYEGPFGDPVSATRVLCGALVLPTIATVVGGIFFDRVQSNLQKALLGGISFVVFKGAFKIYYKQQQMFRMAQRKILDFVEATPSAPTQGPEESFVAHP